MRCDSDLKDHRASPGTDYGLGGFIFLFVFNFIFSNSVVCDMPAILPSFPKLLNYCISFCMFMWLVKSFALNTMFIRDNSLQGFNFFFQVRISLLLPKKTHPDVLCWTVWELEEELIFTWGFAAIHRLAWESCEILFNGAFQKKHHGCFGEGYVFFCGWILLILI